jgi:hypothetical protein
VSEPSNVVNMKLQGRLIREAREAREAKRVARAIAASPPTESNVEGGPTYVPYSETAIGVPYPGGIDDMEI